jgi:hypothetical protein
VHAGLGELPFEQRLGLLVRRGLDVRPQVAEWEGLVVVVNISVTSDSLYLLRASCFVLRA